MIRQRKYLFIGGQWDGQWHAITPAVPILNVPTFKRSDLIGYDLDEITTYHLRRVLIPGWFVPLTVYTTDPSRPAPLGTALPGLIQGSPIDAWSIDPEEPVWLAEAAHDLHDAIRERRYRP